MALFPPTSFSFTSQNDLQQLPSNLDKMRRGSLGVRTRERAAANTRHEEKRWRLEIRCRAEVQAMMLLAVCERLVSSQRALLPLLQLHAGVCAERPRCRKERKVSQGVIYCSK